MRKRMRLMGLFGALAGAHCVPQVPLESPADGTGAGLLAVLRNNQLESLYAISIARALPAIQARHDDVLVLLSLAAPLSRYGLTEGRVQPARDGRGRPLPSAETVHRLVAPNVTWQTLDALPAEISALRLPEFENCSGPERCTIFEDGDPVCVQPCPRLSQIVPPAPVMPPQLEAQTCPDGWRMVLGRGCEPPARQACPQGEIQVLGTSSCTPLLPCGVNYRLPEATNIIFVDAAAPGPGAGTEADPFASLETALFSASVPAYVSLTDGDYDLPETLPDDLTLYGRCPERVRLNSTLRVGEGQQVALDGVSLQGRLLVGGRLEGRNLALEQGLALSGRGNVQLQRVVAGDRLESTANSAGLLSLEDAVVLGSVRLLGSTLEARNVAFEGSSPLLDLFGEVDATLIGVWLSSTTTNRAAVDLDDDSRMVAQQLFGRLPFFAILNGQSYLQTEDLGLSGLRFVARVDGGEWVARRFRWQGEDSRQLLSQTDGRIELLSGEIETGPIVLAGSEGGRISIRDVRAAGPRVFLRARGETEVQLARIESTGGVEAGTTRGSGFYPSYSGQNNLCSMSGLPDMTHRVLLTGTDLNLESDELEAGIKACPGTLADLERVRIVGAEFGIYTDCRRSCTETLDIAEVELKDIHVRGSAEPTSVGIYQRGGRLDLRRADLSGIRDYGIYNWGHRMEASDLLIRDIGLSDDVVQGNLDTFCSQSDEEIFRGPASAFMTEAWAPPLIQPLTRIERFSFSRARCSGVSMGALGSFSASDGEIRNNHRGINILRASLPESLDRVIFKNNSSADIITVGTNPGG